jgi:hypothetical protein
MERMRFVVASVFLCAVLLAPANATAQFGGAPFSDPATGEVYHVELSGGIWNATPEMIISSEALGIIGSDIDLVTDLGIEKKSHKELRVVLRPARKHKFRINYLPMHYAADTTVTREFVFNGLLYRVGLPVSTIFEWNAWRFAYEYDFLYRDRWFVGLVVEAKYTDVKADLDSLIGAEFTHAQAPIPAFGGIVRGYVAPNISITGEVTGIKLPESINEDYRAHYIDFDLYGTVNFTDNAGVQFGYRSLDLGYRFELDTGALKLKGLYIAGVVRF